MRTDFFNKESQYSCLLSPVFMGCILRQKKRVVCFLECANFKFSFWLKSKKKRSIGLKNTPDDKSDEEEQIGQDVKIWKYLMLCVLVFLLLGLQIGTLLAP